MRRHGAAPVISGSEQNAFPEIVHFGHVHIPVDVGYFVENDADGGVVAYFIVEGVDEIFYVGAGGYVGEHSILWHFGFKSSTG